MKLILQLIVLCACFWSARFIKCRAEMIGTIEQNFVHKEAKNATDDCIENIEGNEQFKFCAKDVCFRDGKAKDYVTVYSCARWIRKDCSTAGPLLAILECTEKTKKSFDECTKERRGDKKKFDKEYGNYRCEQCEYGKENEDNGNANFALYKPKESGGTVNGVSHLHMMIFAAVALFGTAIGHGLVL